MWYGQTSRSFFLHNSLQTWSQIVVPYVSSGNMNCLGWTWVKKKVIWPFALHYEDYQDLTSSAGLDISHEIVIGTEKKRLLLLLIWINTNPWLCEVVLLFYCSTLKVGKRQPQFTFIPHSNAPFYILCSIWLQLISWFWNLP